MRIVKLQRVNYRDKYTETHGQRNVKICLVKLWHFIKDFYRQNVIETFHADNCSRVFISMFAEFELNFSPGQFPDGLDPLQTKRNYTRRPLCWEQRQVLPPPVDQFPAGNSPYLSPVHIVRCPHQTLYIGLTPFQTFCRKDKLFLKRMKFPQWNRHLYKHKFISCRAQ